MPMTLADDLYLVLDKEAIEQRDIIGHTIVHFPLVDEVMKTGRPAFSDEVSENMTLSAWGLPIISGGRVTRTVIVLTDVTAIRERTADPCQGLRHQRDPSPCQKQSEYSLRGCFACRRGAQKMKIQKKH